MDSQINIRDANPRTDLAEICQLCEQLGYQILTDQMSQRLALLAPSSNQALVATDSQDRPIGFMHLRINDSLLVEPRLEIVALVVNENHRNQRIGQHLVQAAEAHARVLGLKTILVLSNIKRDDAHRFYQNLGYQLLKTNHSFTKSGE